MQLEAVEFEDTEWVTLAQNRVKLLGFLNTIMQFCAA